MTRNLQLLQPELHIYIANIEGTFFYPGSQRLFPSSVAAEDQFLQPIPDETDTFPVVTPETSTSNIRVQCQRSTRHTIVLLLKVDLFVWTERRQDIRVSLVISIVWSVFRSVVDRYRMRFGANFDRRNFPSSNDLHRRSRRLWKSLT